MNPIPFPSAAMNPSNPDRGEPVASTDLLDDINKAAHAAGTNAWVRDVLNRAHRAIRTAARPPVSAEREALEKVQKKVREIILGFDARAKGEDIPPYISSALSAFTLIDAALSSTDGRSSAGQSESDEIRRLRIDNARLRDENFFLRRTGGGSDMAATLRGVLEMIRDGTDVPEHKREDTAFLRAGCVIANSMAKGALSGSQSPVATDIYEECAKLAEQCALPAYGTNARHTGREEARKKIAAAIRQRAKLRRTVTDWEDVENHVEGRKHD